MIKKLTIEKTIHIILVLIVYVLITITLRVGNGGVVWILLHYTGISAWIAVFYCQAFWLFPKYLVNKKFPRYFLFLIMIIFGLFLIHSTLQTIDIQNQWMVKSNINKTIFETYFIVYGTHLSFLGEIVSVLLVSLSYSWIKLSLQKGLLKVNTLIVSIAVILAFTFISIAGIFHYQSSYNGEEKIKFLDDSDKYQKVDELFSRKEFKGNVLYIDIWGPNCGPCIKEFQNLKKLKERYRNESVKFIYLVYIKQAFIKHSADVAKWKSIIKKYEISGYHMQMNDDFCKNIWAIKGLNNPGWIPHYIIVDKNGNVIIPNAESPGSGEKLYKQLDDMINQ